MKKNFGFTLVKNGRRYDSEGENNIRKRSKITGANSRAESCANMSNAQKKRILEGFDSRRTVGEDASQKSMAEWTWKEMNLAVMPNQSTISSLCKNRQNYKDNNPSFNLNQKGKRKGCIQRSKMHSSAGLMRCTDVECSFLVKL